MEAECEKIEQEIQEKYNGRIRAAYGCSLGGSFVALLMQRKKIHIDHGIIGSSDMDEAGFFMAKIQSAVIVPIMYKMVQTGKLPGWIKQMRGRKNWSIVSWICLALERAVIPGSRKPVFTTSFIQTS